MDGPNGCHADLGGFQLSHMHWDSQEREITWVERIEEYVSECYTRQIQAHVARRSADSSMGAGQRRAGGWTAFGPD